jgi:hypothetical protein
MAWLKKRTAAYRMTIDDLRIVDVARAAQALAPRVALLFFNK